MHSPNLQYLHCLPIILSKDEFNLNLWFLHGFNFTDKKMFPVFISFERGQLAVLFE